MARKKTAPPTPIGKKIKAARTRKKMTLEAMANETGFSIDALKRIESGDKIPPVGALLQIARALEIDSALLLKEQESKLTDRIRAYTKRTENYAYDTLTPGAENKHLKAFRVKIDAGKVHKGVSYQHEGEEFVYVLDGQIEVMVGDHANLLTTGESLHFNSGIRHKLTNTGKTVAELLVVIYNP